MPDDKLATRDTIVFLLCIPPRIPPSRSGLSLPPPLDYPHFDSAQRSQSLGLQKGGLYQFRDPCLSDSTLRSQLMFLPQSQVKFLSHSPFSTPALLSN